MNIYKFSLKKVLLILVAAFFSVSIDSLSQSLKVCVKTSNGQLALRTKCNKGYTNATISTITKTNTNSINSINSSLTSINSSITNRFDSIPSGKTAIGYIGFDGDSSGIGDDYRAFANLPAPPTVALTSNDVIVASFETLCSSANCLSTNESNVNSVCTGSTSNPTAPSGKVCIYLSAVSTARIQAGTIEAYSLLDGKGIALSGTTNATGDIFFHGVWAYTAP